MKFLRIPISEWAPDRAPQDSPTFTVTDGWPGPSGYRQPPSRIAGAGNISGTTGPTGTGIFFASDGNRGVFYATQDRLFRSFNNSFPVVADVTGSALSATSLENGGRTEFVQWEDDVICTNYVDPIQRITPYSATSFTVLSSATATPQAKTITAASNFLIVGNTFDATDGTSPQRVQWSALGDPTDWAVSAVTQSDFNDLKSSGGPVLRVIGNENPVVFQRNAINRMTYVGTPEIWGFDEIEFGKGLFAPGAAAILGSNVFYLSDHGFEVLVDGVRSERIGANRVDRWFFLNLDHSKRDGITCAASRVDNIVVWGFPNINGTYEWLVYDYTLNKWGHNTLVGTTAFGIVAEYVNTASPTPGGSGDGIANISYSGSLTTIIVRTGDNASEPGEIETGWLNLTPGRTSMIKSIKPGLSVTPGYFASTQIEVTRRLSLNGRDTTDTRTAGTTTAATSDTLLNRYAVRSNGTHHKIKTIWHVGSQATSDARWFDEPEITHIDVEYVETGSR